MNIISEEIKHLKFLQEAMRLDKKLGRVKCDGNFVEDRIKIIEEAIKVIEELSMKTQTNSFNHDWIPCDLELPKPILYRDIFNRFKGYYTPSVLVTVESNECDGIHRYVSTDSMRGQTKNDMRWLMSCGYGGSAVYSQKIIAWQPLPKSYKKDE